MPAPKKGTAKVKGFAVGTQSLGQTSTQGMTTQGRLEGSFLRSVAQITASKMVTLHYAQLLRKEMMVSKNIIAPNIGNGVKFEKRELHEACYVEAMVKVSDRDVLLTFEKVNLESKTLHITSETPTKMEILRLQHYLLTYYPTARMGAALSYQNHIVDFCLMKEFYPDVEDYNWAKVDKKGFTPYVNDRPLREMTHLEAAYYLMKFDAAATNMDAAVEYDKQLEQ